MDQKHHNNAKPVDLEVYRSSAGRPWEEWGSEQQEETLREKIGRELFEYLEKIEGGINEMATHKVFRETRLCRGKDCYERVHWVEMVSGKSMPIETKGEMRVVEIEGEWYLKKTYAPHWATCPNADDFKKRG